ncbi:extracellular solute-binding protein [Undibacterium arcticum]
MPRHWGGSSPCCGPGHRPIRRENPQYLQLVGLYRRRYNQEFRKKETGIKVRYDNFDSNEILHAKLVAGRTGYDIVVPSAHWARLQIDAGLLRKLDKSKIPNLVNLDPTIQAQLAKLDPNNDHLVDWLWGYTTVGINVDKVKAALGDLPMPENVFDLVFDPKYMAKVKSCGVSFLDAPSEIVPPALRYLGKKSLFKKTVAITRMRAACCRKIRPYVTLFSSSGYINDMANGSICVALGWSGDMNIARQRAIDAKNGNKIEVLVPKNGATLFFDTMAIPSDAQHPNNALLFMNYILRPEVHAGLTNKVFYANPNTASIKFVKKRDLREQVSLPVRCRQNEDDCTGIREQRYPTSNDAALHPVQDRTLIPEHVIRIRRMTCFAFGKT